MNEKTMTSFHFLYTFLAVKDRLDSGGSGSLSSAIEPLLDKFSFERLQHLVGCINDQILHVVDDQGGQLPVLVCDACLQIVQNSVQLR